MAAPFKPVNPTGTRSRIRISGATINALGWNIFESDFKCLGLYRTREELLCAPEELKSESGDHPFADVISIVESVAHDHKAPSLGDIPQIRNLVASERLISFGASWTSETRSQLDLNLGVDVTDRLGWSKQTSHNHPIYLGTYAGILIVLSERRYQEAHEQDLTT
jgi:hypothetical protein